MAVPRTTQAEVKAIFLEKSCFSWVAVGSSSMGSDSPVIPELSTENSVESRIRQSAGTTSPTCKIKISPKDTRITQVMDGTARPNLGNWEV